MATRRSKNADEEKLDSATLERVISLLEPTTDAKPITKKEACSILNITYNTTRLAKLIEVYKEKKAREAAQRASKRGKPATQDEIVYAIKSYLEGEPVDTISNSLYRSAGFVNKILEDFGVPIRARSQNYFEPEMIPDAAVRDRFTPGQIVYSARYDSTARIEKELDTKYQGEYCYRIWLLSEKWQQYALQPASELASLEHLEKLGIKF
ncbi:hypothetical protein UFOVP273_41 [uncultured Caudovirales phage]|uniref:Uncharacterized protein n=1 Tax=uncultured Caudovirales phage TaxID=2100421 RepID=A0A6J5LI65_9CAUD|nr:hypothetical protein UFOVP273_41 [uncultured Caudovirales phage]